MISVAVAHKLSKDIEMGFTSNWGQLRQSYLDDMCVASSYFCILSLARIY